jgi:dihydroorotase
VVSKQQHTVTKDSLLYKCGWSPFEGQIFDYAVDYTFVNGCLVYSGGQLMPEKPGQRLLFSVSE